MMTLTKILDEVFKMNISNNDRVKLIDMVTELKKQNLHKAENLWDMNSEYIGDDLFAFENIAGTTRMDRKNFMAAAKELIK